LYSAIFADFHLFEKLYGIRNWQPDVVAELIKEMQLTDKTAFENGQFTNINLSTGQRKRIAMIVAKLEERDVYIFDEWAADQDPTFREYYYYELLPELKKAGKTIIVVSHDDSKYYATADRVLKMDMGKMRDITDERKSK
jgi:putative ATP-binding cassette transporter